MNNLEFPQQIFTTADGWGDEFHFDETGMETNIEELKKLGDEWGNISIDDCTSYFIEEIHGNRAIYRRENHRDDAFYIFEHDDFDMFKLVNGPHDSIEWAREMVTD